MWQGRTIINERPSHGPIKWRHVAPSKRPSWLGDQKMCPMGGGSNAYGLKLYIPYIEVRGFEPHTSRQYQRLTTIFDNQHAYNMGLL